MSGELTGKTLCGYRFGEVLAKGLESVVYAAHKTDGEEACAVKVFDRELPTATAAKVVGKAQRMADVLHRNVVPILEAGSLQDAGQSKLFIAMERLHGEPLGARLAVQPGHVLPQHVVLQITGEVGGALQALHVAGLTHTNVSPSAVFVSPATDEERQADLEAEDHVYLLAPGARAFFAEPQPSEDVSALALVTAEMLGGLPKAEDLQGKLPSRPDNEIPARLVAVLRETLSGHRETQVAAFVAALLGDETNLPTVAAWSEDGHPEPPYKHNRWGLFWPAVLAIVAGAGFGLGYWLIEETPSGGVPTSAGENRNAVPNQTDSSEKTDAGGKADLLDLTDGTGAKTPNSKKANTARETNAPAQ